MGRYFLLKKKSTECLLTPINLLVKPATDYIGALLYLQNITTQILKLAA